MTDLGVLVVLDAFVVGLVVGVVVGRLCIRGKTVGLLAEALAPMVKDLERDQVLVFHFELGREGMVVPDEDTTPLDIEEQNWKEN